MHLFVVAYDLDKPGQDWHQLIIRLKALGAVKMQFSLWMVRGDYTAEALCKDLLKYIDANDRLLVVDTTNGQMWWRNLMADPKATFALA